MISLSTAVFTERLGDARQRHIDYAARAGHITMIIYAARAEGLQPAAYSPHLDAIPTNSLSRFTFVWDAYRLAAHVHRERPVDVVTTQDPFATGLVGLLLKRRRGLPLQVQNNSVFIDNPYFLKERALNPWLNRLAKFIIRRADALRVLNRHEKAQYVRLGLDPDRVSILPIPVNLAQFMERVAPEALADLRARLGLRPEHRTAIWVGRPVPFKDLPLLFKAAALVRDVAPDFRLVLAGDFSAAPQYPALARALGLDETVIYAGRVPHKDLPAYYALAQCYVHSSLYEGLGLVMIEASAAGLPVVSTRNGGAEDIIVDGETGLLTRAGDPDDLAEKLIFLLQNPDLARAMGARAREHVRQVFDRDRQIDALVEAWRTTAAMRGA